MSVTILNGDIFESGAQCLANPVNCVGTMGKGLAREFKDRYPEMFREYALDCKFRHYKLRQSYLWENDAGPDVMNIPTKNHWRDKSRVDTILASLRHARRQHADRYKTVAIPALGCGYGGLYWEEMRIHLVMELSKWPCEVVLYEP